MAELLEKEARADRRPGTVTCRFCNGTGKEWRERKSSLCYPCPDCKGSGRAGAETDDPSEDDREPDCVEENKQKPNDRETSA